METIVDPKNDEASIDALRAGVRPAGQSNSDRYGCLLRLAAGTWFILLAMVLAYTLIGAVKAFQLSNGGWASLPAILSRSCTFFFYMTLGWLMLVRPPAVSRRRGVVPTIVAFLGTYAAFLIPFLPRGQIAPILQIASAAITLFGSLTIVFVIVHLGRSFSIAPQARKLVIGGPYRIVRHPLYVAEEIAIAGTLIQYAWFAALPFLIVHIALQIRRMFYEESVLRDAFPDYAAYAHRTARLIPGIW